MPPIHKLHQNHSLDQRAWPHEQVPTQALKCRDPVAENQSTIFHCSYLHQLPSTCRH